MYSTGVKWRTRKRNAKGGRRWVFGGVIGARGCWPGAQWAPLISQWQCQGSWQGPDARHQLQCLVNRLLSRWRICAAMVARTHRHMGTCIECGGHADRHWLIVSPRILQRGQWAPLCLPCRKGLRAGWIETLPCAWDEVQTQLQLK